MGEVRGGEGKVRLDSQRQDHIEAEKRARLSSTVTAPGEREVMMEDEGGG